LKFSERWNENTGCADLATMQVTARVKSRIRKRKAVHDKEMAVE
jgi:hypothetical protein